MIIITIIFCVETQLFISSTFILKGFKKVFSRSNWVHEGFFFFVFVFFEIALLRYNLHIQFIYLKCAIQWFLLHVQSCAAVTMITVQNSLMILKQAHGFHVRFQMPVHWASCLMQSFSVLLWRLLPFPHLLSSWNTFMSTGTLQGLPALCSPVSVNNNKKPKQLTHTQCASPQSIHVKCKLQIFLVYPQHCASVHHHRHFQNILISPGDPHSLAIIPNAPSSSPWNLS